MLFRSFWCTEADVDEAAYEAAVPTWGLDK